MMDELLRHKLFNKLETVLGVADAAVLIEHLPPMGWADVATRRDIEQLTARLDSLSGDVRDLQSEFVGLRSDISYQFRTTGCNDRNDG